MDEETKKDLQKLYREGKIQSTEFLPEKAYILVSRVKDFDPKMNEHWKNKELWSYPRDLFCSKCNEQVMMSDATFKMRGEAEDKGIILCTPCFLEMNVSVDNGEFGMNPKALED
jgi:formylmethanofuran dehydrogenase subunit E